MESVTPANEFGHLLLTGVWFGLASTWARCVGSRVLGGCRSKVGTPAKEHNPARAAMVRNSQST
eukprot:COSAG02_NODE_29903_length_560_cov_1.798265_1_plen_63_part_10